MPKVNDTPLTLRPYIWHGIDLTWSNGATNATATCPFCGKEGKFSVKIEDGQWRCFVCNEGSDNGKMAQGGNAYTFMRMLWETSDKAANESSIQELMTERSLLYPETLTAWGVTQSAINDEWLVPGYNTECKLNNLYRYVPNGKGKKVLFATPGMVEKHPINHQLHGVPLWRDKAQTVYVCEGFGDGMVLYETMRNSKLDDRGRYIPTSNPEASILTINGGANVLAVPGANVFTKSWGKLLAGKKVVLLYDSDHPGLNAKTGKTIPPVGLNAAQRVTNLLAQAEEQPAEVHYLHWGPDGYDPNLPSKYDVRDWLTSNDPDHGGDEADPQTTIARRAIRLQELMGKVKPVPSDWVVGRAPGKVDGKVGMDLLPCQTWKVLVNSWRKSMKWTEGLDRALSVMLACIISTKAPGDQLWAKIIGPASCGKSTLCEAVSANRKYVYPKSNIQGFFSGYKTDKTGKEDHGLIAKVRDKCLVTKDGDTLLKSARLEIILSQARDIYDRVSRSHYNNATGRDYEGISMTWLLCGTSALCELDSSDLGGRFLDCIIMREIDDELEEEILWQVAHRTEHYLSAKPTGKPNTDHLTPEQINSAQLTGGYVDYLCKNAIDLLAQTSTPEEHMRMCIQLGRFVSMLRGRPSKKQAERVEREMGSRLVSQHLRLARCLTVVLNKKLVDTEVMRRVRQTAIDTASGMTMDIAYHLASVEEGLELKSVVTRMNKPKETINGLLRYMRDIGAADYRVIKQGGYAREPRWQLTPKMFKLWRGIMGV